MKQFDKLKAIQEGREFLAEELNDDILESDLSSYEATMVVEARLQTLILSGCLPSYNQSKGGNKSASKNLSQEEESRS